MTLTLGKVGKCKCWRSASYITELELHHLRVSLKAIKETRRKFTVYLNLCVMLWELLKSKFKDQSHEKIQNIQQGVF